MSDATNKVRRRSGYTSIPNAVPSDTRLSIAARGMLCLLMSMSENWQFRGRDIQKQCCVGKDKYQSLVRELKAVGYLEINAVQGDCGKFHGYEWVIHDDPAESLKNGLSEDQTVDQSGSLSETNIKDKTITREGQADLFDDRKEAIKYYKAAAEKCGWPSVRSVTGKRRDELNARLSEHGLHEWERVIDYCSADAWFLGENKNGWLPSIDYFVRASSFNKMLERADLQKPSELALKPAPPPEPRTAEEWLDRFYREKGWNPQKSSKLDAERDVDLFELSRIVGNSDLTAREAASKAFRYHHDQK